MTWDIIDASKVWCEVIILTVISFINLWCNCCDHDHWLWLWQWP